MNSQAHNVESSPISETGGMGDDFSATGITKGVVKYAIGQPFNNVLLLVLIAVNAYLGYYAIQTAIPLHLKTIQEGYETINKQHSEELRRLEDAFTRILEVMDRRQKEAINDLQRHRIDKQSYNLLTSKKVASDE